MQKYKQMGFMFSIQEHKDLLNETKKFADLVSLSVTPQKFMIKLLYDHIKRNKL